MTISERIFERLKQLSMAQREFSVRTGIRQSTISEWKKNKTNPSSDKIMVICKVLEVSPEWLLSGVDAAGARASSQDYYVIDKKSELGVLIEMYNGMSSDYRSRMMGYISAIEMLNGNTNEV